MFVRTLFSLWVAKFVYFLITFLTSSSGSTWPGHLALKIDGRFVEYFLRGRKVRSVLVVGTNGKTTTSSMIKHLLKRRDKRVFGNAEGANLLNGIASTLVKHCSASGKLEYEYAIFEVDENNLSQVLKHVRPDIVVALNLFRDQLDRYGEVNTIAEKWHKSLEKVEKTTLVLNTDDPLIRYLGYRTKHDVVYFDVGEKNYRKQELTHDVDSVFCPDCGNELVFSKTTFSHLGKYSCKKCNFKNGVAKKLSVKKYPLDGLYNMYNVHAALLTTALVLGEEADRLGSLLSDFSASFGRGEKIEYRGRKMYILLSKNPAGFNQSLQRFAADKDAKHLVLALNDNVPDGRDVSWIWDVDFEKLDTKKIQVYLTGDRVWDLGIRMQYAQNMPQNSSGRSQSYNSKFKTFEQHIDAIESSVNQAKKNETIYVLATYSAMLDIRKILVGRKLL